MQRRKCLILLVYFDWRGLWRTVVNNVMAEGEELGSNLLQVLHRRPTELDGLGNVAGAAPALPPGPKAAKRAILPRGSQNLGWL
jgi:hypothetical protein